MLHGDKYHQLLFVGCPNTHNKSKIAAILKKNALSEQRFDLLSRTFAGWRMFTLWTVLTVKNLIFEILSWWTATILKKKPLNRYNLVTFRRIAMKFATMEYFDSPKPGDSQSFEILKIQHGSQPPS